MDRFQKGAVSLFAVIFTTLLLTILTVSFIKLMVIDQQQSTDNDLSQSAYDSALAGVEDAKRVIRKCQEGDETACLALASATSDCRVIERAKGNDDINYTETLVQSSVGSNEEYDQAYTCVNIEMDSSDYVFTTRGNRSEVVPLKAKGDFSKIEISWFPRDDASSSALPASVVSPGIELSKASDWPADKPPLMRAQLISPNDKFQVDDLDSGFARQTAFALPTGFVPSGESDTGVEFNLSDPRRAAGGPDIGLGLDNKPDAVVCSPDFGNYGGYSCRLTIKLGDDGISASRSANTFLRINTLYGSGSEVMVRLLSSDDKPVRFDGVQPKVDSTGRANNLYRRVEARLRIGDDFAYPDYSVDVKNSLCKDFAYAEGDSGIAGVCKPGS